MKLHGRTISVLSAIVTLASAGGLVALYAPSDARAAGEGTDSAVTVEWAGGNGDLQQYQPDRTDMVDDADGSGHWDDFKDLEVTVSQTENLTDQAVTLTVAGMSPTVFGGSDLGANNFLQVMQCWGDDPNDAEFAKTCQWGGFSTGEVGGIGSDSIRGVLGNVGEFVVNRGGLKFRTVGDRENVPVPNPDGNGENQGLGEFFTGSSSNEVPVAPIGADGTARVSVVVQSGAAQPYLGCGDPKAAGERCWLVVVPRGVHSGSLPDGTKCGYASLNDNGHGESPLYQTGSPVAPTCSFWRNRVVVPLDFANPFQSCPPGSEERRVVGSELFAEASSSWQPALCAGDGATFSLTTNSGDLSRSQLLTGQADFAAVSQPLTRDTIGPADPGLLDAADLRYAPLTNTALTIGFVADGARQTDGTAGVVHTDLKLTPRLVAKLLTQSYKFDVTQVSGSWESSIDGASHEFLSDGTVVEDEEWRALGNPEVSSNASRAVWLVNGPQGDDAIRLLWEYVLADADAVAFLRGTPDPWGNTVNRYYLPPAHRLAAGGGTDLLSTAMDTFPKSDRSVAPSKEVAEKDHRGIQLDSTAYSPYSGSFEANAARILRVDTRLTFTWDPNTFVGIGTLGVWSASKPAVSGATSGRLALGPVTAPAAELYRLNTAQLALPLPTATDADSVESAREFVGYDDETVAAAIAAQEVDERTGFAVNDPGALPSGAYPLATTLYGAVDLEDEDLTSQARADYAGLLDHAAGDGNVHTGARGGLPEGYVPLTPAQVDLTHDLADLLRNPPNDGSDDGPEGDDPEGGDPADRATGGNGSEGGGGDPSGPAPDRSLTVDLPDGSDQLPPDDPADDASSGQGADGATTTTQEAAVTEDTAPLGASVALGGTLIAGLAGMVGAPFLLRRRDLTG